MDLKILQTSGVSVSSKWSFSDYIGAGKVRLSIGRNKYRVEPGLYELGNPGKDSEVFVSANYKLSFDILRKNLQNLNAWILVMDTKGINVWCAAGKGTFGTAELINRINLHNIDLVVSHRRLIVPQLGAPGVAAHMVKNETGFNIKYGPVRASDIDKYIDSGFKADETMRKVQFNFMDRLIVSPVEIMNSLWQLAIILIAFFVLSGVSSSGFSFTDIKQEGFTHVMIILMAYLSGTFFTPVLLPWLPFRYFSAKGIFMQTLIFFVMYIIGFFKFSILNLLAWYLMSVALSSFLAMNFTGASTYTSLSGVKKEMRIFVPVQIVALISGFTLYVVSKFV